MNRRRRSRRTRIALVGFALVVSLGLAEIATRLLLPPPTYRYGGDPANRLDGLLIPHADRGYAMAPEFSGTLRRDGRRIVIETNRWGLRDGEIRTGPGAPRLALAVGNSFTVGFGVQASEAWPEQLERALGQSPTPWSVLNAGVSGYSLAQIRKTADELSDILPVRLLLVGVYPGAYWRIANPYVLHDGKLINSKTLRHLETTDDGLIHSPYEPGAPRRAHLFLARSFRFGYYLLKVPPVVKDRFEDLRHPPDAGSAQRALEPLLVELELLHRSASSRGIPVVALLISPQSPSGGFADRDRSFHRIVRARADAIGLPWVDPLPRLQEAAAGAPLLRFDEDHHWTPLAHRLAAEILAEHLLRGELRSDPVPQAGEPSPSRAP